MIGKDKEIGFIEKYSISFMQLLVFVFLFCMVGIFPLYYRNYYYQIGNAKFDFFWKISLTFIVMMLVLIFIRGTIRFFKGNTQKERIGVGEWLNRLSDLDYALFIYALCVLLSYAFSDYKDFALRGAAGWNMGLCTQIILITVYFMLSAYELQRRYMVIILVVHLITSAATFLLGILHRFDIDPLGMYQGLELYHKVEFLSTFGQATWFSSYVCTVFAVGMMIFYFCRNKGIRFFSAVYTVISFGILVTQNSDSAFISVAAIMLVLGYFSLKDRKSWCRFWQIMCLMWGTFGGIGILQQIFSNRIIPLDSLSLFFSQSQITWLLLSFSLVMMIWYKKEKKEERSLKVEKRIYQGIFFLIAIAVIVTIGFIYLNTKGYLLEWLNYQNRNSYLLFDYHWGSNRGSTWMICWQKFIEMPMHQKLFGVGPDSVAAYLYSMPDCKDLLHSLWGNVTLTNAHNEYLNSLLCYGIVGAGSWIAVLLGGSYYFYQKAKKNPVMIIFVLCMIGYACHNIFCYQQVCCTPFLFILLGMGERLTKSENFNTIK